MVKCMQTPQLLKSGETRQKKQVRWVDPASGIGASSVFVGARLDGLLANPAVWSVQSIL